MAEQSKGLGDTVAKVTHTLKVDKLAEEIAKVIGKGDCGCKKRQEKLNNAVPYKKKK